MKEIRELKQNMETQKDEEQKLFAAQRDFIHKLTGNIDNLNKEMKLMTTEMKQIKDENKTSSKVNDPDLPWPRLAVRFLISSLRSPIIISRLSSLSFTSSYLSRSLLFSDMRFFCFPEHLPQYHSQDKGSRVIQ